MEKTLYDLFFLFIHEVAEVNILIVFYVGKKFLSINNILIRVIKVGKKALAPTIKSVYGKLYQCCRSRRCRRECERAQRWWYIEEPILYHVLKGILPETIVLSYLGKR